MNVHITYKAHKTSDVDKEIQHWISKIQKRLQVFRPELIHLKGSIEENSPREGTVVSLNLRLPSGQMAVQQASPAVTSALKAAFSDLLEQIGKHKGLLRSSHSWRRHRALEGVPKPEVPFEETFAAVPPQTATSEDVRSYLNANLRRLRLFIEREIYFRENSGDLQPGSVSPEEVLDEAVARALDEKIEKPDRIGAAWDEALKADRPSILEFHTDPEVPPLPPHITPEQAKKFVKSLLHDPARSHMLKQSMKELLDSVKV